MSNPFFGAWLSLNWLLDSSAINAMKKMIALVIMSQHDESRKITDVKLTVRLSARPTSVQMFGTCLANSFIKDGRTKPLATVINSYTRDRHLAVMKSSESNGSNPMQLDHTYILKGFKIQIRGKQLNRMPRIRSTSKQLCIGSISHKSPNVFITHCRFNLINRIGTVGMKITKAYVLA